MPRASMRSRAARTRAAAPWSPLAARRRCTPRGMAEKLGPRPGAGAVECRGRLGGGLSARADRLRDRALRNCSGSMRSMPAAANALLAAMRDEAEAIVRRGAPDAPLTETRSAFMRYRGQGHEIAVPLPTKTLSAATTPRPCCAAFEDAYRRLYSRVIPGVEVELLSWVLLSERPTPRRTRRRAAVARSLHPRTRPASPGLRPRCGRFRPGRDPRRAKPAPRRPDPRPGDHRRRRNLDRRHPPVRRRASTASATSS